MIIFIESNTSGTGEYLYKLCKKKKINFIFLIKNKNKYPWLKKENFQLIDTSSFLNLKKKIKVLKKKNKIKFIVSTSDQFVVTCNKLCKEFSLEFESIELLDIFKNKFECLKLMKKMNAVKRKFLLIKKNKQNIKNITYPCILKPNNGTGSIDVKKIHNRFELTNNIKTLKKKYENLVLDDFIIGQEYSLEVLFIKNKIIFDQLVEKNIYDKYHFVESGHLIYPQYNRKVLQIKKKLITIVKKFKLNKIFLHIEFKIDTKGNLEVIEINPRLAGGFIPILIKHFKKLDLIDLYIDILNGKRIKKINYKKNKNIYKIFFLIPPKSNQINKIIISNKVNKIIIEKKIYKEKLKNFKGYSYNFSDRLGHIVFKAKNIKELIKKEKEIQSNIRYIY